MYCVHSPLLEGASYIISPGITGAYSGYREKFISPGDAGVCFENQPSSTAVAGAICDLNLNSVDDSFSGQLFEYLMSDECEFMLLHDLWVLRHKIGGTKVFVNNVQWSDQMM